MDPLVGLVRTRLHEMVQRMRIFAVGTPLIRRQAVPFNPFAELERAIRTGEVHRPSTGGGPLDPFLMH